MSTVDDVVHDNAQFADRYSGPPPGRPLRRLAVVTCMDTRLDLLAGLGLQLGDAHLIRNAGGMPTDDVLRSLVISQRALGTREIAVVHHTLCGMAGFDDDGFRGDLTRETGAEPPWRVPGFDDVEQDVRRSVQVIRDCPWLLHRDVVRGFVLDVSTARLSEVS